MFWPVSVVPELTVRGHVGFSREAYPTIFMQRWGDGYSYLTQNTANRAVHTNPTRERGELPFSLARYFRNGNPKRKRGQALG